MNNSEFFNAYVENLLAEIMELTKVKLMMKTQMDGLQGTVNRLNERVKELEGLDNPAEDIEEKDAF